MMGRAPTLAIVLLLLASEPVHGQFAFRIGDESFDAGRGIATDSDGNTFVTGWFAISGDFDPSPKEAIITVDGFFDAFVASYDEQGGYRWAFSIPVINSVSQGLDIATVPSETAIQVGGWFSSTADFDPDPETSVILAAPCKEMAAFVSRYATEGQYVWAIPLGGCLIDPFLPGVNITLAVGSTPDDGVLATGVLRGEADLDPGPGEAPFLKEHGHAIFIASYDAMGSFRWGFQIGDDSAGDIGAGYAVVADPLGGAIAAGVLHWPADFDPDPGAVVILTPVSGGGRSDGFVASYDNDGAYRWAFNLGSPGTDLEVNDLTIDTRGNVYVTGNFEGPTDFDPDPVSSSVLTPSTSSGNGFIASYDAAGDFRWAFNYAGSDGSQGRAVTINSAGHLVVAGTLGGTADLDPDPDTEALFSGTNDGFIASYTTDLEYRWAGVLEGPEPGEGAGMRALAPLPSQRIAVAGELFGTVDFDPGPDTLWLTSAGQSDIFVAAYADGGGFPVASEPEGALPTHFALEPAYPNPFNPRATIPFALPEAARVTLTVYDVLGREITRLADGLYEAGRHRVVLDGSRLASGLYLVRAVMAPEGAAAPRAFTRRLTLLK